MALVLRTNGAPLSGALFVSNPNRTGLALKTSRRNRRNRTNRRNTAASKARRNAALRAMRNRKNRRNSILLNYHGNRSARRNGLALVSNPRKNRRTRRNGVAVRRNSYGAFDNKATNSVSTMIKKVPVVGTVASQYVAPLLMGAAVGAVHYGVIKGLKMIPGVDGVMGKIKPVQFTLSGVAVATALRFIPLGSQQIRDQLAVGALLVGSALDVYRFMTEKVGELGEYDDMDGLGEYDDMDGLGEYDDMDGLYEDGFIEAGGLYEDGYIEAGDGGAYDVLPLAGGTADLSYSGASLNDARFAPADLSVDEGEAALAGPGAWHYRFGPPSRSMYLPHGYSPNAGQPGHRFGWLIQLVGFPRFQKIVALPPGARLSIIARLRKEAEALVDGSSAPGNLAGLAINTDMSGLAIDMNGATLDMSGELSGLVLESSGLGALMSAGAAV